MTAPRAAYVHVPFCLHRCGYCDFTVIAGRDDLIPRYLSALETELRRSLAAPTPVDTLFLGGGTPSRLPAADLERLCALLQRWLPLTDGGEFSIECNPEQFTPDRMDALAAAGVNRVSLGVQTFDTRQLRTLERGHEPDTVAAVVSQLQSRGIANISFDLIFAVPGQTLDNWEQTLQAAIALAPAHVSTYGLTYEQGTSFWTRRSRGQLLPAAEDLERDMYEVAMQGLPAAGFVQYELSNFARPGRECRHNEVYWASEEFYGFGPGAAALIGDARTTNVRSVVGWLQRLERGDSPVGESEQLSGDLRAREAVMLGLRRIQGIEQEAFVRRFGTSVRGLAPREYDALLTAGLLEETPTRLRLSRAGRFVADSVMAEFF